MAMAIALQLDYNMTFHEHSWTVESSYHQHLKKGNHHDHLVSASAAKKKHIFGVAKCRNGGYTEIFTPDYLNSNDKFHIMRTEGYLSEKTRAIFLEFTIYNFNLGLYLVWSLEIWDRGCCSDHRQTSSRIHKTIFFQVKRQVPLFVQVS